MTQTGNRQCGVTLLELMIVTAIIAIISSIAYPSYERYVVNTNRTAAASTLLRLVDRQQQFFMDNKRFAADLNELGFAANPQFIDDQGQSIVAGDPSATYVVGLANVTATGYTAVAAPLNRQATKDAGCGALTITQSGSRGNTGASDDCW